MQVRMILNIFFAFVRTLDVSVQNRKIEQAGNASFLQVSELGMNFQRSFSLPMHCPNPMPEKCVPIIYH